MFRVSSSNSLSTDSYVFYVERLSAGHSPTRKNTPKVLNSIQLSGPLAREVITISSVASLGPQIVTIEPNWIKPTMFQGNGRQQLIIILSINYLNLPMNTFRVMTSKLPAPVTEPRSHTPAIHDIQIQKEPFDISDMSTPSLMVSSVNAWGTSSDVVTFLSVEPGPISLESNHSSTLRRPRRPERKLSMGIFFPKKQHGRSVTARLRCLRLTLTSKNGTPRLRITSDSHISTWNFLVPSHSSYLYTDPYYIRISYWTGPDWNGTITEQTNIYTNFDQKVLFNINLINI